MRGGGRAGGGGLGHRAAPQPGRVRVVTHAGQVALSILFRLCLGCITVSTTYCMYYAQVLAEEQAAPAPRVQVLGCGPQQELRPRLRAGSLH